MLCCGSSAWNEAIESESEPNICGRQFHNYNHTGERTNDGQKLRVLKLI